MSASTSTENATASCMIQSEDFRCFSLDEILTTTNNFDDALAIGIGGFGKVYKGYIDNGMTMVAIKRLNRESKQGANEFWTEVKMLSKLRHRHLVALIGHCNDSEEMILVYEYMAHGTLANHLYETSRKESGTIFSHLLWEQRLDICMGAARGLDYLHSGTHQSFIHRDVKTTNILLDKNWVAKISDFGLSKATTSHSITHISTQVKGTFGYLDPHYFFTHNLTKKSDVYAFGVVLLEVLCGRPPVDKTLEEEQISLVLWFQRCRKKGKLDGIIDPSLCGQITQRCLRDFVELANRCLHKGPKERPTMAEVVSSLELALASQQQKRRMKGIITKAFQSIVLVPKSMDLWLRERKDKSSTSGPSKDVLREPEWSIMFHHFSFADLETATFYFSERFLTNRYGSMYKGKLIINNRHVPVGIKRFKDVKWDNLWGETSQKCLRSQHCIGSLIGYCDEKDELICVYEYVDYEICIGAARGLPYLHTCANHKVVHGNANSSDILLDKNWVTNLTT